MKHAFVGLLLSAAVAGAASFISIGLAVWAPQDRKAIQRHLSEAISTGVINETAALGVFDAHPMPIYGSDCMLLSMMVTPPVNAWADAISNRRAVTDAPIVDSRVPPYPACQALLRALPEFKADGNVRFVQYDNYILGMKTVGGILLSIMPLEAMSRVLLCVVYAVLIVIAGAALFRLSRAHDAAGRSRAVGFLVISLCLALFYGLPYFGRMLYFAPLELTHFLVILAALLMPLGTMRLVSLGLFAAAYGSGVAIFEFLTGGIPFALALLPMLLALGFQGERRGYLQKLAMLWGCFCLAVVACFAIKKLLGSFWLADPDPFLTALFNRMYSDPNPLPGTVSGLERFGVDVGNIRSNPVYATIYLVSTYLSWSRLIAWGSSKLGTVLIITALSTVAIVTWRHRKTLWSFDHPLREASLLGLAAYALWTMTFFDHTILHPFFMARMLVIPILAGSVLVATEVLRPIESPLRL